MYLFTENEVAVLRHSELLIEDDICMANKKYPKIALNVKGHQLPTTSRVYHETCTYQVTSISVQ